MNDDFFNNVVNSKSEASSETSSVTSEPESPSTSRRKSGFFGLGTTETPEEKAARKAAKALLKQQEKEHKEKMKQQKKDMKEQEKRAESDLKERKKTLSNSGSSYSLSSFVEENKGRSLGTKDAVQTASAMYNTFCINYNKGDVVQWNAVGPTTWKYDNAAGNFVCGTAGTYYIQGSFFNSLSTAPLKFVFGSNNVLKLTDTFSSSTVFEGLYTGASTSTRAVFAVGDTLTVSLSENTSFVEEEGDSTMSLLFTLHC